MYANSESISKTSESGARRGRTEYHATRLIQTMVYQGKLE